MSKPLITSTSASGPSALWLDDDEDWISSDTIPLQYQVWAVCEQVSILINANASSAIGRMKTAESVCDETILELRCLMAVALIRGRLDELELYQGILNNLIELKQDKGVNRHGRTL